jgi:hypothetical protein
MATGENLELFQKAKTGALAGWRAGWQAELERALIILKVNRAVR